MIKSHSENLEKKLKQSDYINTDPARFRPPVKLVIAGIPVAQTRPRGRVNRFGKGIHFYSDQKKQIEYTRHRAQNALGKDFEPFSRRNALKVKFIFYCRWPISYISKKRHLFDNVLRVKRPDLSNYIKFYEDALRQILWLDDANIAEITAHKTYSRDARTEIYVTETAGEYDIITKVPPL